MFFYAAVVICMSKMISAAPISVEVVDLTHAFDETTQNWPGQPKFKMEVTTNGTTKEGYWVQIERYYSGTHSGTHLDAPCHIAEGKWSVDQIPLHHLIAPAAVIDISERVEKFPDASVEVRDLENWERTTGLNLNNTIILMRSDWSNRWSNTKSYIGTTGNDISQLHFPGMSAEAAQWLVDNRKVYGVGSESLSLDSGSSSLYLMAHRILLEKNIFGMENVANMAELPIYGATLHVFPMKIGYACGAPVRIIATFPKLAFDNQKKSSAECSLGKVTIF